MHGRTFDKKVFEFRSKTTASPCHPPCTRASIRSNIVEQMLYELTNITACPSDIATRTIECTNNHAAGHIMCVCVCVCGVVWYYRVETESIFGCVCTSNQP